MSREDIESDLVDEIRRMQVVHLDTSVAQVLFRARSAIIGLEAVIDAVLHQFDIPCEYFTYDEYDLSIEIYGVGNWVPTPEQHRIITNMGFAQFWTHPGTEKEREIEKHYGRAR